MSDLRHDIERASGGQDGMDTPELHTSCRLSWPLSCLSTRQWLLPTTSSVLWNLRRSDSESSQASIPQTCLEYTRTRLGDSCCNFYQWHRIRRGKLYGHQSDEQRQRPSSAIGPMPPGCNSLRTERCLIACTCAPEPADSRDQMLGKLVTAQ